jgi:LmbE family N-acetylglucosaminyl deacetylase
MLSPSASVPPDRYVLRRAVSKILRPLRRLEGGELSWETREDLIEGVPFGAWADQRLLVVIAHPDDEAFCSGLVAAAVAAGAEVRFLCLTRGEGGDLGGGAVREELGSVREGELRRAGEALGVSEVEFLGYVDPLVPGGKPSAPAYDSLELTVQLRQAVLKADATVVVTHGSGGEYWHPAHVGLHDHVGKAVEATPARLLTMNAWNAAHPLTGILNRDDIPDYRVDGAAVFEARLRALEAHETQRGVFERFSGGTVADFVRATAKESYRVVK